MAFKRALVVDDSRSARISLKRLLEEQGLDVVLAESGEEAISLLGRESVDVIFMDHTMPGMDGLEALTAIKSNPLTATIPVMMYTTKEGEVYVSQARALGAIGVLPKEFQPHVLFDMLLDLGLVNDRRAQERPPAATAEADGTGVSNQELEHSGDQQAVGMSVQALVTRVLEDQHMSLRADILQSHRDFAKQVAAEVLHQQRDTAQAEASADAAAADSSGSTVQLQSASQHWVSMLMIVLTAATIVFAVLYWQLLEERGTMASALAAAAAKASAAEQARSEAIGLLAESSNEAPATNLLDALTWAVNRDAEVGFSAKPFNADRAERLSDMLDKLASAGFQGTLLLESHLGRYCLVSDDAGAYQPAPADLPLVDCALIGHPLDDSTEVAERQSEAFKDFMEAPLPAGIELQLVAHDGISSQTRVEYPANAESAGDWNQVAALNNRVELALIPQR